MFKKKTSDSSQDDKGTKKATTKTVEQTGGVQTTTTTITCAKADFDTAFKKLNLDPKKFQSGGTTVTRQIIYTNSSGQKEVLEETVENYEQDEPGEPANGSGLAKKLGFGKSKTAATSSGEGKVTPGGEVKKYKAGEFEKECLKKHNENRAKHGVPKLTLSDEICAYAKEWADHLASKDLFEHRSAGKYGENIFMKWSSDPNHMVSGEEAVDSWYSEIKDYTFGQEPRTLKSGHFTQVVWKASKEMGVAWAKSKSGKILVVANYSPAGNFVGKFTDNVPPLKNYCDIMSISNGDYVITCLYTANFNNKAREAFPNMSLDRIFDVTVPSAEDQETSSNAFETLKMWSAENGWFRTGFETGCLHLRNNVTRSYDGKISVFECLEELPWP